MGFRNLVAFNKALLAKQTWRLIQYPDSLISRILKAKYFNDSDVMKAKIPCNASYTWRSLAWSRDLLSIGLRWRVGNGANIEVIKDAWCPGFTSGEVTSKRQELENLRVKDLTDNEGNWNIAKMKSLLNPVDVEEISKLSLDRNGAEDYRYWMFEQKGDFSVKTGYLVETGFFTPHASTSTTNDYDWWKYLWSFELPPRVKIFAWRIFKNIIPSKINLLSHHIQVRGLCSRCGIKNDTTNHALIFCKFTRDKWKALNLWKFFNNLEFNDIREIGEKLRQCVNKVTFEKFIMGMWLLWRERNSILHGKMSNRLGDIEKECKLHISYFKMARAQAALAKRVLPKAGEKTWSRPQRGRLRLDVDYAEDEGSGTAGVGAIIRNSEGEVVLCMTKPIPREVNPLMGELKAVMHGILDSIKNDYSPNEVYTDSLLVLNLLEEDCENRSIPCSSVVKAIFEAMRTGNMNLKHCKREANQAAHTLARFARQSDRPHTWYDLWPSWLHDIVMSDRIM